MMLQEPLLVVVAFYLLFVVVIIYVRLDFAISKVLLPASRVAVLDKYTVSQKSSHLYTLCNFVES